ncbi:hypothetical protein CVS40_8598 [Lucilia cuprina]|nr:hypothetical protein CVS40_8598 [Lucilia cuprina]
MYRTLKVGEAENDERLEKAFKPITEPLKTLVNNAKYDKSIIENLDTRRNSFNIHEMSIKVGTSTPKKDFQLKDDVDDCDDDEDKSRSDANSVVQLLILLITHLALLSYHYYRKISCLTQHMVHIKT